MNQSLAGKIAFITGGASGIGEACVRLFAQRGARVVLADINMGRARGIAESVGAVAIEMDVASPESIQAAAERSEREVGATDIVVSSAGITQRPLPPERLTVEEWDRVCDINLRGAYLTAVAFGGRMAERGRGSIISIASISGMRSTPLHAYGVSKAGVISLTENLAAEWGRSGVRVNAISPGYVLTPLLKGLIDRGERDAALLKSNSALGRMVEPEEIARAAAFLASDDASSITGINLPIESGWLVTSSWNNYGGLPKSRATAAKR